jgi:hypothetical protein
VCENSPSTFYTYIRKIKRNLLKIILKGGKQNEKSNGGVSVEIPQRNPSVQLIQVMKMFYK